MTTCTTAQEQQSNSVVAVNDQTLSGTLDSILVSFNTSVKLKSKVSTKPLSWIIDEIRNSRELKKNIDVVRAEPNASKRQELKKNLLPYFTFCHFEDGVRKKECFKKTKFIVKDLDHLSDLKAMREKMLHDPEMFIIFLSPSSDGLKVVFALDHEITTLAEYDLVYEQLDELLVSRYGIKPDPSTKDASRATFLSFDPDLFVNPSVTPICVMNTSPPASQIQPINRAGSEIIQGLQGASPGGRTRILTQIIGLYIEKGFDRDFALEFVRAWNVRNTPPHPDEKLVESVNDMYNRYDKTSERLPVKFFERHNCYMKNVKSKEGSSETKITTFVIRPKELLVLDNNECLVCDITSLQGHVYEDVTIESSDWHSKQKLLKAIGHQDCVCVGNDNDLQALCVFVNELVPMRKTGTKVIGLHDNTWVTEGVNITGSGISTQPTIVPYDKGSGAFYHKISYSNLNDTEYASFIRDFYANITAINEPKVIMPFIGWIFSTPVKELIRKKQGSFPSALIHGGQGSGKTSTSKMFMRLVGYTNPVPSKCDMKPFPMLKNLSATNGIPQFYDEFKQIDMRGDAVDSLLRYLREIYDGELEQKGREDQTTEEYELLAPIAVMGEWNINQPAIRERALMIRFTDAVKRDVEKQRAFKRLLDLPLEGFMPRFIQFCLRQDIRSMLTSVREFVENHFVNTRVAPRILDNLSVMMLGLQLFQEYAVSWNAPLPKISPETILADQLKEITGTDGGQVRSSVDQLIEELGIMWQKSEKQITTSSLYEATVKQVPWWKLAKLDDKEVVAIRFNKVFPEFKEYAQRTKYEGDLLDKESYLKLFKECDYIVSPNEPVNFEGKTYRSLCVNTEKAKSAGIDLEGFGITSNT